MYSNVVHKCHHSVAQQVYTKHKSVDQSRLMDRNIIYNYAVFALAGVILVIMLFLLYLTVSDGTIHGLIFYANIVAAKKTHLPTGSKRSSKHLYSMVKPGSLH